MVGHGFSIVKEALVEEGRYFSQAGYVTPAIDYRTFGESEGEPRSQLFPLNEVEDFRNAISYLQSRDEVDPQRVCGELLIFGTNQQFATHRSTTSSELFPAAATNRRFFSRSMPM